MKRVLADFHHAGLLHSLIMLFEDRLGYEVYRPIGMEWAEKGFWKVYDHPDTQKQYLSTTLGYKPVDGSPPLNNIVAKVVPGVYYCQDIDSGYYNKAITFEAFKNADFDIIIASLPQHIEPFKKLIAEYQPKAKLIFQVGNQWDGVDAPNIMASAKLQNVPEHINYVEYHQEFSLKLFNAQDRNWQPKSIGSFMNCPDVFPDYHTLLAIEEELPDWDISIHGGQGRDGSIGGAKLVAEVMRSLQFVWHVKAGGDGYGHILFNTAACGVPTIVKKSYYSNKLGEKLLIDGVTCIDIDGLNGPAILEKLLHFAEPTRYTAMCKNVEANFISTVNFDDDEKNIRAFLERLK